jgi:putative FmdB family regulatory protein
MPLYDYKCRKCRELKERIARFDENVIICECGGEADRQIHGKFGIGMGVGAYGYFDETLNTYISTNKQRREEMKKQGVSEAYGKRGWR